MQLAPFADPSVRGRPSPWRDTLLVLLATALGIVLAARFDWSEALYALTRHQERLQLDELPTGMLIMLTGLLWLTWRRNQQARREILSRRATEAELERALRANRELSRGRLRIQEEDRKHLARELHDELGQYLNAIKLDAVQIRDCGARDTEGTLAATASIIRTVDHLHEVVGRLIAELRPVALDELGLVAAIEHNVDEWRRRLPGMRFRLSSSGDFEGLDEALGLTVYRLIQEALTNVYKHAAATQVEIDIRTSGGDAEPRHIVLTIADDGRGMDLGRPPRGHGLNGMRERVELAGGRFEIETAPGRGFRFEARLPVDAREATIREDAR